MNKDNVVADCSSNNNNDDNNDVSEMFILQKKTLFISKNKGFVVTWLAVSSKLSASNISQQQNELENSDKNWL